MEEILQGYGYQTDSMESNPEASGGADPAAAMIFGGLAAFSCWWRPLGITNTMIMSIYERTRRSAS